VIGVSRASDAPTPEEPTPTQQKILDAARENPEMNQTELADEVGCSDSYVSETLREYGDPRENADRAVPYWLLVSLAALLGLVFLSGASEATLAVAAVAAPIEDPSLALALFFERGRPNPM